MAGEGDAVAAEVPEQSPVVIHTFQAPRLSLDESRDPEKRRCSRLFQYVKAMHETVFYRS